MLRKRSWLDSSGWVKKATTAGPTGTSAWCEGNGGHAGAAAVPTVALGAEGEDAGGALLCEI